jgi:hypothetical protein
MPEDFTDLVGADWTSVADGSLLTQLVTACNERLGAAAFPALLPAAGDDAQDRSVWLRMQGYAETMVSLYLDHIGATGGSWNGLATMAPMTVEIARTIGGLNPAGFRRVPEGVEMTGDDTWRDMDHPKYAYGQAEVGDQIGPWLADDLQRFLSALQFRLHSSVFHDSEYRSSGLTGGEGFSEALANGLASWSATPWAGGGVSSFGLVTASVSGDGDGFTVRGNRSRHLAYAFAVPVQCSCSADIYYKFGPPVLLGATFQDVDEIGAVEGRWFKHQTLPVLEPANAVRGQGVDGGLIRLGDYDIYPPSAAGLSASNLGSVGMAITDYVWVLHPQFTNTHPEVAQA